MKPSSSSLEGFIKSLDRSGIISTLIYGQNTGGVSNLYNKIASQIVHDLNDPFLVANIDIKKLEEDQTILLDELNSIPMFGGKKLVVIKNAEGTEITKIIEETLGSLPDNAYKNCFLLVTAGELDTKSALRKLYEAGKNIAAIACYNEDERSVETKIKGFFYKNHIQTENGVAQYIIDNCKGDSKVLEILLEKLVLFLGADKFLNLDDVKTVTGSANETNVQEIINLFFDGNIAETEYKLRKSQEEGVAEILVIRSFQKYIEKLHRCIDAMNEGKQLEQAVMSARPPVFFKQVPEFKKHILKLKSQPNLIWKLYHDLTIAEASIKESGADSYLILSKFLAFNRK
ncbi:MAG TPA: DNA polymerase III subunit delta [Alphaproteobacteria bacterium]|nr:DNA polymerase III subunit delta [Alphaproteobacteria bacterium]